MTKATTSSGDDYHLTFRRMCGFQNTAVNHIGLPKEEVLLFSEIHFELCLKL